ncbi:type 1 glutamine amidotransferase domain-containing protein [Nocardia sp.]|uniref:type 1 glutamine amidotransferase domain-containing protein n=1 Tax=Nocardia sp. TaxID=1821 RepID=UPI002612F1E5|nr:type 1 glutamine amidotransferase domain-containing protein [Nocardia sp.]
MSHKNLNPVDPAHPKRVAIVISNPGVSSTTGWPVGFWWAELTHPYFKFTEVGYQVEVFSPEGGACTADAMSDPEDPSQWQAEDVISRGYKHDPAFVKLIENTRPITELAVEDFDCLVVAGGQGPMFTFENATALHTKFTEFYEAGKVTAALCHGVAILRYATLTSGEPLVAGKTVTGFANIEEDFADRSTWDMGLLENGTHIMPWRIEDEVGRLGGNYVRSGLWSGFAIRDGNLVTGQQNFSGGETADLIIETLGR